MFFYLLIQCIVWSLKLHVFGADDFLLGSMSYNYYLKNVQMLSN